MRNTEIGQIVSERPKQKLANIPIYMTNYHASNFPLGSGMFTDDTIIIN